MKKAILALAVALCAAFPASAAWMYQAEGEISDLDELAPPGVAGFMVTWLFDGPAEEPTPHDAFRLYRPFDISVFLFDLGGDKVEPRSFFASTAEWWEPSIPLVTARDADGTFLSFREDVLEMDGVWGRVDSLSVHPTPDTGATAILGSLGMLMLVAARRRWSS